ncbi:MAG: glycosyltransferase, partial [Eubacterium sp.]|nr:glycosyltransferase [Eubacterium sp.]
MATLSLCMIVKNEEAVLSRCLESIKDAVDEIVIVDTGSTDTTKEIAKKYTDLIYD